MPGGNWVEQNKVRPGVYVNFEQVIAAATVSRRGIVAMPLDLNWGAEESVIEVTPETDTLPIFGATLADIVPLREALKRAKSVLAYRLNPSATGVKATVTSGNLVATAKYTGTTGNSLKVVIEEDGEHFDVKTYLGTTLVDSQQDVDTVADLENNDYVVFTGAGVLAATAGATLTTGTTVAITATQHSNFRAAVEPLDWDVMGLYGITDNTVKGTYETYIRRLRDEEGNKVQLVLEIHYAADYEGVTSVKNGVTLTDGTVLTAAQAVAWVSGAMAKAQTYESLTHDTYEGANDVATKYTASQIETALGNGEFLFTLSGSIARVEYDINTLTTYTSNKGSMFSKNRVVRTLDAINNDIVDIGDNYFIGKIDNNADGRNLLKNEIIKYLESLQNNNSIQNFSSSDVSVVAGTATDAVVVSIAIQTVDSIEKVYITVEIA